MRLLFARTIARDRARSRRSWPSTTRMYAQTRVFEDARRVSGDGLERRRRARDRRRARGRRRRGAAATGAMSRYMGNFARPENAIKRAVRRRRARDGRARDARARDDEGEGLDLRFARDARRDGGRETARFAISGGRGGETRRVGTAGGASRDARGTRDGTEDARRDGDAGFGTTRDARDARDRWTREIASEGRRRGNARD